MTDLGNLIAALEARCYDAFCGPLEADFDQPLFFSQRSRKLNVEPFITSNPVSCHDETRKYRKTRTHIPNKLRSFKRESDSKRSQDRPQYEQIMATSSVAPCRYYTEVKPTKQNVIKGKNTCMDRRNTAAKHPIRRSNCESLSKLYVLEENPCECNDHGDSHRLRSNTEPTKRDKDHPAPRIRSNTWNDTSSAKDTKHQGSIKSFENGCGLRMLEMESVRTSRKGNTYGINFTPFLPSLVDKSRCLVLKDKK